MIIEWLFTELPDDSAIPVTLLKLEEEFESWFVDYDATRIQVRESIFDTLKILWIRI